MGVVADRDDEVPVVHDIRDLGGADRVEGQVLPVSDLDRPRMHPGSRMGGRRGDGSAHPSRHSAAANWERAEL
jgi:hypothetical protein